MSLFCLDSDPECKTDAAIDILSQIYGYDFIHAFLSGGISPYEAVPNSLGPIILGGVALVAGMLAIVLLFTLTFTTLLNSAQDGEAFGKGSSKVIITFRFIFAVMMLFPTAAGYCVAQIVLMAFVLWSNGETNKLYFDIVMKSTIKNVSSESTSTTLSDSVDAFGVRGFALAHFQQAFCLNLLNANYSPQGSTSESVYAVNNYSFNSGGYISNAYVPSQNSNSFGPIDSGLIYVDPNNKSAGKYRVIRLVDKQGVLALPNVPVCGSLKITYPVANDVKAYDTALFNKGGLGLSIKEQNNIYKAIAEGSAQIAERKSIILLQTTANVSDWLNKNVNNYKLNDSNYLADVDFDGLRTEIKNMQLKGNQEFQSLVKSLDLERLIEELTSALTAKGWTHAAGIKQRILSVQTGFINSLGTNVVSITPPDFSTLKNDDDRVEAFKATISNMNNVVTTTLGTAEYAAASDEQVIAQTLPSVIDNDTSIKSINEALDANYSTFVSRFKKRVVYMLITGNFSDNSPEAVFSSGMKSDWINSENDVLSHIQNTGEIMGLFNSQMNNVIYTSQLAVNALLSATPVVFATQTQGLVNIVQYVLKPMIESGLFYTRILETYMAVIIPSMPYFFFITGIVAWFVHILQAMAGLPFWAVMHIIPNRSFVGSQHQGYIAVISLFLRPILTITGLFFAFLLANPILILATETFFSMQDQMLTASTSFGLSHIIFDLITFSKWLIVYCTLVLSICYMIFGLAGTLPDTVLKWLGSGLNAGGWGESNAREALSGGTNASLRDQEIGRGGNRARGNGGGNGGGGNGGGGNGGGGNGGGGNGGNLAAGAAGAAGAAAESRIMTPTSGGVAESYAERNIAQGQTDYQSPDLIKDSDPIQQSNEQKKFNALGGLTNSDGSAMNVDQLNKLHKDSRTSSSQVGYEFDKNVGAVVGGMAGGVAGIKSSFGDARNAASSETGFINKASTGLSAFGKGIASNAKAGAVAGITANAQRHFATRGGVVNNDSSVSKGQNVSGVEFSSAYSELNRIKK